MFRFDERYNIQKAPFKWFEGPIYKFIDKKVPAAELISRHVPA